MVVTWSPQAKEDLAEIWNYYSPLSLRAATRYIHGIRSAVQLIAQNPKIAPIELQLDDRPEGFRSFVVRRRYKVIYCIEGDTVNIVFIWDCRRNPATLRMMARTYRR
jgi:plasmid stabilization system protein ParE